jgi:hypothetical protein
MKMTDNLICPICGKDYYWSDCKHYDYNIVAAVNEARQWARKLYRENAELRRQLEVAREALECAEYAITHPDSDQDFACMATHDALNQIGGDK